MFGLCEGSSCSLTILALLRPFFLVWPLRQIISCNICICKYSGRVCPIADPLVGSIFKASIKIPQEYDKLGEFQTAKQGRFNRFCLAPLSPGLQSALVAGFYKRAVMMSFLQIFSGIQLREKILLAISSRPPLGLWQRSRDKIAYPAVLAPVHNLTSPCHTHRNLPPDISYEFSPTE